MNLLANKGNQAILGLLAVEPAWPRKIGQLVSLSETETSRRLKRMEALGLVTGDWAHLGKNVKLYSLAVRGTVLHFTPAGLEVRLEPFDGSASPTSLFRTFGHEPPPAEGFVGRTKLLDAMDRLQGVTILEGLPGMGKTSLAAQWATHQERPVFWHSFRGVESLRWLANHLAIHHAQHGERRWLDTVGGDLEDADMHTLIVAMLQRQGSAHVLDDLHRIEDDALLEAIKGAIPQVTRSTLIITSRTPVRHDPTLDHVHVIVLEGLDDEDLQQMFTARGLDVPLHLFPRIREEVGGHPLALNLLIEAADRLGLGIVDLLDRVPEREVEDYLLEEVYQNLDASERQVLTLASIFRGPFTLEDLRALTQKDPDHTLLSLRRRLLVTADDAGYRLHEILRNFFYQRLGERKGLHTMAAKRCLDADTLEGRLEAMYHFLAAGKRDKTLDLLEEDLDLRTFDFLDGAHLRLYSEVLDSFTRDDVKEPYRWAVLEDDRGDIAYHRKDDRSAIAHYQAAEEIFRAHDARLRLADLAWKKGLVLERLGRLEEARSTVEAGLTHAGDDPLVHERLEELHARLTA